MQRSWKIIKNVSNFHLKNAFRNNIRQITLSAVPLKVRNNNTFLNSIQISNKSHNNINNIDDLVTSIEKGKTIKIDDIKNVIATLNFYNLSEDQIILLLECCGKSIPNASPKLRNQLCQQIYGKLLKSKNLNLNIYHTYIKICTENEIVLNHDIFLKSMICKPNHFTFRALLNNACEKGDILQVIDILNVFKEHNIPADEQIFNDLVLGHSVQGGLKATAGVLDTIKVAQIPVTDSTKFSILKGLAIKNDSKDFLEALNKYRIEFKENQFLQLLEKLGKSNNLPLIKEIIQTNEIMLSRDLSTKIELLCIHLIHSGQPEAAILIYKSLIPLGAEDNYAQFFFEEMLLSETPVEKIIKLAKDLHEDGLNSYLLEYTTGLALKMKYFDKAIKFLEKLPEIRPHYFWPLLLNSYNTKGEKGVKDILEKMVELNVKIDCETLENYIIPFLNFQQPEMIVESLKEFNLTVRQIMEPLLLVLIKNNQSNLALELCQRYNVIVDNVEIINLLVKEFKNVKDLQLLVGILQKICESKRADVDLVGNFLIDTLNNCTSLKDFNLFLKLLQTLSANKLRINQISGDNLANIISSRVTDSNLMFELKEVLQGLIDFNLKTDLPFIAHPKQMDLTDLESHLIELKSKNMETRGVLRKLILKYSSIGNVKRVEELRKEFLDNGYEESSGMISGLMYSYVTGGFLDAALKLFNELKEKDPKFKIDEFKLIDMAALMVSKGHHKDALDFLKQQTEKRGARGGESLKRNCWRLLLNYEDVQEQEEMFQFLVEKGYCKAVNIILGPLIKIHLKRGDIQKAVKRYIEMTSTYGCTPLQLELLLAVIQEKDEVLLKKALEVTAVVHGKQGAVLGLLFALAEREMDKPLKKLLLENGDQIPKNRFEEKCQRWVNEGKIGALLTLWRSIKDVKASNIDGLKSDCKGALDFYEELLEAELPISQDLEKTLFKLLKQCKYEIPKKLQIKVL